MNWILIYWIIGAYSITNGGMVTGTATFSDQAACQAAVADLQDTWAHKQPNGTAYGLAGGTCSQSATPVVGVSK